MNNLTSSTNWFINGIELTQADIPPDAIGFIYVITELSTGKKYIGKKMLYTNKYSVKTITIKSGPNKGQKKKKKTKIPIWSDWIDYYGSSAELLNTIFKLGVANYHREIIRFCNSKSELSYYEAKEQFITDCLLKPNEYYNAWVMCRVRRSALISQ